MAFTSVNGFLNYVANGNGYVECSDGSSNTTGACPPAPTITGPGGRSTCSRRASARSHVEEAGTQTITQHELALFLQDSWKPQSEPDAELRPPLGGADRARPDHAEGPALLRAVHRADGDQLGRARFAFPGDGTIPSRLQHVPAAARHRVGRQGRRRSRSSAPTPASTTRASRVSTWRAAGAPTARAGRRSSATARSSRSSAPRRPTATCCPRRRRSVRSRTSTCSTRTSRTRGPSRATVAYERELTRGLAAPSELHPRADRPPHPLLQRQRRGVRQPLGHRAWPGGNGIGNLFVVQSTAKSRYQRRHGRAAGAR